MESTKLLEPAYSHFVKHRLHVWLKGVLVEGGRVSTGEVLNTLVQQTVLLVKQNKHFRSLTVDDQAELCQVAIGSRGNLLL